MIALNAFRILIDADGCPVVNQTVALAKAQQIDCVILCDTAHLIERDGTQTVTVEKGPDCVDFKIVQMLKKGDIVVTQDYGLAAMCLAREAFPVTQNGLQITSDNIDALLFSRYVSGKMRNAGVRVKGPAKRSEAQNAAFVRTLNSMIATLKGI